jgi:hypothetical protein
MDNLNDPVKLLARRFVNLPPHVRLGISGRLLRLRGEDDTLKQGGKTHVRCSGRRSFLEQFWDEVEAAHGDGLYPANPFAVANPGPLVCAV